MMLFALNQPLLYSIKLVEPFMPFIYFITLVKPFMVTFKFMIIRVIITFIIKVLKHSNQLVIEFNSFTIIEVIINLFNLFNWFMLITWLELEALIIFFSHLILIVMPFSLLFLYLISQSIHSKIVCFLPWNSTTMS